jgi:Protein of unknown function (DUF3379)
MTDHEAYRRALLAEPRSDSAELRAHVESCAECGAYRERLLRFEARLERALRVDIPEPARGEGRARDLRPRRFALAASALLAMAAAGVVWLAAPRPTLAAAVVAHVVDEPQSWSSHGPVADPQLAEVLRDAHMRLRADAGTVSYASSCEFRGHVVPHLVVQSAAGPATVMVLVHEKAARQTEFDEQGYRGVIVPVPGHGSIALLMRSADARMNDVEQVAAQVRQALVWEP